VGKRQRVRKGGREGKKKGGGGRWYAKRHLQQAAAEPVAPLGHQLGEDPLYAQALCEGAHSSARAETVEAAFGACLSA